MGLLPWIEPDVLEPGEPLTAENAEELLKLVRETQQENASLRQTLWRLYENAKKPYQRDLEAGTLSYRTYEWKMRQLADYYEIALLGEQANGAGQGE